MPSEGYEWAWLANTEIKQHCCPEIGPMFRLVTGPFSVPAPTISQQQDTSWLLRKITESLLKTSWFGGFLLGGKQALTLANKGVDLLRSVQIYTINTSRGNKSRDAAYDHRWNDKLEQTQSSTSRRVAALVAPSSPCRPCVRLHFWEAHQLYKPMRPSYILQVPQQLDTDA